MKRYSVPFMVAALVMMCASATLAIFPIPDGYGGNFMQQGWYNNTQAWYIKGFGSNDIGFLKRFGGGLLSPKLSSLLQPKELGGEIAARPMYIVLNPAATQGPIFSAAPGQVPPDLLYSGFWQVFYIQWKPGATRRPIINDTPGDPQGLPTALEADIIPTSIVAHLPMVAIGPLGGPWLPAPPGRYRIKQGFAMADYTKSKILFLPAFYAFCQNSVSRRVNSEFTVIPDATDADLADLIGANWAPGLENVPDGTIDPAEDDTQAFYWIPDSPWLCQYPILEACPNFSGRYQNNPDFTPVARVIELDRNVPYWSVINNPGYVEHLILTGGLTVIDDSDRIGMIVAISG